MEVSKEFSRKQHFVSENFAHKQQAVRVIFCAMYLFRLQNEYGIDINNLGTKRRIIEIVKVLYFLSEKSTAEIVSNVKESSLKAKKNV